MGGERSPGDSAGPGMGCAGYRTGMGVGREVGLLRVKGLQMAFPHIAHPGVECKEIKNSECTLASVS